MKKKATLLVLFFTLTLIALPAATLKAAGQSSITRSAAEQRAINMINLTWTYSKERNSNIDPKYAGVVEQPQQLKNVSSATFTGIPYDWGGIDSLDSNSYNAPWTNFLDAVNMGAFIGNVSSSGGFGLIPGTAGVDCSGFVQAVFNVGGYKLSTSTLFDKYFKRISLNEIKHMDILNYPGHHVVIFDRWGTRNGVYGAYTYEATTNQYYGGIQGTKRYFLSLNSINNAYTPGRYINIVDGTYTASTPPSPSSENKTTNTGTPKTKSLQSSASSVKPSNNISASNTKTATQNSTTPASPSSNSTQSTVETPKTGAVKTTADVPRIVTTSEGNSVKDGKGNFLSTDNLINRSGLANSIFIVLSACCLFEIAKRRFHKQYPNKNEML